MEDRQKVYIKGDLERGNEVIKILTDLGGRNIHCYAGDSYDCYYYINPDGVIAYESTKKSVAYPFIRDFYKEIKLPKWKPKLDSPYFCINTFGKVVVREWKDSTDDNLLYKFGNCFNTSNEAEKVRSKIFKILNYER